MLRIDTETSASLPLPGAVTPPAEAAPSPGRTATPPTGRTRAGDEVAIAHDRRATPLTTALQSAQVELSLNDAAEHALSRARDILIRLRVLVAQGAGDGRPPAETAAERQYLSLVHELADLGRAAPPYDDLPTGLDLTGVAAQVEKSRGTGLGTALEQVAQAHEAVTARRPNIARAMEFLSAAAEQKAAAGPSFSGPDTAARAAGLLGAVIVQAARSALAAQTAGLSRAPYLIQE